MHSWSVAKKLEAGFKDRLGCVIQEQNYIAVEKQRVHIEHFKAHQELYVPPVLTFTNSTSSGFDLKELKLNSFKSKPEEGFKYAETYSCVLLNFLYNKVVLY